MTHHTPIPMFRTLFLSDVHLGSRAARADLLIDFLDRHDAETIYLVGDIVDGWRLRRSWHWPASHNDVIRKILGKAQRGTRVVYIPGNHDEFARDFLGRHFGDIEVKLNDIHETADGRRFLVMHGDEFDVVVRNARLIAHLGDFGYDAAIAINHVLNIVRRRIGFGYWSFSSWVKLRVKNAVAFIGAFETALANEAARWDCDGVICGHIHHPQIATRGGIEYVNTGDWVESCSAVAERHDGRLELIRWTGDGEERVQDRRRVPVSADVVPIDFGRIAAERRPCAS